MNLVDSVFATVRRRELWSHPAIVCDGEATSYGELLATVRRCGGLLRAAGVVPGDRVALVCQDGPELVAVFLGSAAIGAVPVPLSTLLSAAELGYVLGHCGARLAVVTTDQLSRLDEVRASLPRLERVLVVGEGGDPEDGFTGALERAEEADVVPVDDDALAFLLYTSGSTGRPKGATHRHADIAATCDTYGRHVLELGPEDRVFSSSRLFFAYGLGNSLSFPLSAGATVILCRERPTPAVIARIFEAERPTVFFGVPAVYAALNAWMEKGEPLPTASIRLCLSAGEMLPERTLREFEGWTGLEILDGIGSTELLHIFISNTRGEVRPGGSGREVPGYEAKLVDADGAAIEGAGSGRLLVRGASATRGYWQDDAKTAETIEDGWVRTGDVYRRDESGTYWFEGRSDDLFKVKGLWVSPVEVEEALVACDGVREAAVVAGVTRDGATVPVAYLVLSPEARGRGAGAVDAITSRLRSAIPSYKCPARIHLLDELPRTATGKVQRYRLRGHVID